MYSDQEDIKYDNFNNNNHNDFVKTLSTTIEKYVNKHVEERVSKYEDYDKIIELIHGLPIIEKKQRKIEKLKKRIRKLKKIIDENSENIKLVIEEKKEIIDLTSDNSDNSDNDEKELIKVVKVKEENVEDEVEVVEEKTLCKNTDCVSEKDDDYDEPCNICDGYYKDDGLNDIVFIEENPNNKKASCDLCKKTDNKVKKKDKSQYISQNACDEEEEE